MSDGTIDRRRFQLRTLGLLVLFVALVAWPWPYRIHAPAVIEAEGGRHLFVTAEGRIISARSPGETVQSGDVVVQLQNLETERRIAELQQEVNVRRQDIAGLERRRIDDAAAGAQLPAAREAASAAELRLAKLEAEAAHLRIVAPVDGVVLPLPQRLAKLADRDAPEGAARFVSPLSPDRRERYLAAGTPLCTIGPAASREAVAVVAGREVEFVRVGAEVRLQFDSTAARTWPGRVVESTLLRPETAPDELVAAALVPLETGAAGHSQPAAGSYLVRIKIDEPAAELPIGAIGQARIVAKNQSLARRARRFLSETFRIRGPDSQAR
ncbi:MAG: hypothetical protein QM775_03140 [Pirellulales bacterium]